MPGALHFYVFSAIDYTVKDFFRRLWKGDTIFVIYFSGTGNSKYIAQQFAKRMHAQAYDIEQKLKFDELFEKKDTIAVCYPIYGSCVPLIMRKFVAKYKNCFQDKKLIIFCTQMLFSGDGARAFCKAASGMRQTGYLYRTFNERWKIEQKGRCTLCYRCVNLYLKQSCTVLVHQKQKNNRNYLHLKG